MSFLGQIVSFSWMEYFRSVTFAAFIGGVLGLVMSLLVDLLVEWVLGRRLPETIKWIVVFIGVVVGYATAKVLFEGK